MTFFPISNWCFVSVEATHSSLKCRNQKSEDEQWIWGHNNTSFPKIYLPPSSKSPVLRLQASRMFLSNWLFFFSSINWTCFKFNCWPSLFPHLLKAHQWHPIALKLQTLNYKAIRLLNLGPANLSKLISNYYPLYLIHSRDTSLLFSFWNIPNFFHP